MLRHYIKIALRSLAKQRVLAFINIMGLTVGLACFCLFLLYAVNEFSYDRFHVNAANIFRVNMSWAGNKDREPGGDASSFTPLGPALKNDFPDVQNFVRFQQGWGEKFVRVDNTISRIKLSFADDQLFNVFSFKLLSGNKITALKTPNSIVLTKDKAIQLFGETDVVGKRLDIKVDDTFEPFVIGAVAENIPLTSSIKFDVLGNFDYVAATRDGKGSAANWNMTIGIQTFVQLIKGSHLMNEPERMAAFRRKYYPNEEADYKKAGEWDGKSALPVNFTLQPLRDVHTNVSIDSGPDASTDPKQIWLLVAIASGVLLIACINFTTLAIGRSAGRAKEVGVRKVIGSGRKQLIYQFLTESLLLSIFSAALGLLLANVLLPYFNQLAGRELVFSIAQFPELGWLVGGLIILAGLLAGSYPALVLSGFKPVDVLKSKLRLGGSNGLTKSLVSIQFILSIGFIISTIIIMQQLDFLRSKNLGFAKENVLVIDAEGADTKRIYPLFKQSLQIQPQTLGMAAGQIGLGEGAGQMGRAYKFHDEQKGVIEYPVDAQFLPVMNMQLVAGRNFDPAITSDSTNSIIVNETLAQQFGFKANDAIGARLQESNRGGSNRLPAKSFTIIGVIRDFNFESLNLHIRPQLFRLSNSQAYSKFFVRIKPGYPSKSIAALEATWKNIAVDIPFKYSFLDEDMDRFYKSEQRWSSIFGWAGGISIFLACLGLYGLAALAAINRTREIGIRKVLGASVSAIVGLLSKNFLKLVAVALLIASPLAWYFMNNWLQNFAYRIDIGLWVFVITGGSALMIALITVGFQAVKAGVANPVKNLRTE